MSEVNLRPKWDKIRNKPDLVETSAMQAALIAIATANSSAPTDGQAIVFQSSTGNLIWGTGGTSLLVFKRPDGTSGYFRPDGTSTYERAA